MFVVLLLNHPFKEDVSMAVWQYDSESMRSLSYARMQVDETCRDMPDSDRDWPRRWQKGEVERRTTRTC